MEIKSPFPPATWIDGVARSAAPPETFQIPSDAERAAMSPGDFVKLGLETPESGERFWVEVVARIDDGRYVGRIDNEIDSAWGLAQNDHVIFEPRHILDVEQARAA